TSTRSTAGCPTAAWAGPSSARKSIAQSGKDSRSASRTGSERIASPMRRSLVTRTRRGAATRSSTGRPPPDAPDEIARGVPLGIPDDDRADPERGRDLALGDALHRVVGALRVRAGEEPAEQRRDRVLLERRDPVHALERGDELHALLERKQRTPLPLEPP